MIKSGASLQTRIAFLFAVVFAFLTYSGLRTYASINEIEAAQQLPSRQRQNEVDAGVVRTKEQFAMAVAVNLLLLALIFAAITREMDQRQRAEEALRRSEKRFRSLTENSSDVIAIVDGMAVVSYLSPSVHKVFGYQPDELIGRSALNWIHSDDLQRTIEALRAVDAQPGTPQYTEFRFKHKDGSWCNVETVGQRPIDDSAVEGIVVTARDVTDRNRFARELERQTRELRRSNAELEQFAYVASHDLQEPLRMVTSFTQLLSKRYRGKMDAEADEFIDYVVDGVSRMQGLIHDLLAYSRVGSRVHEFTNVDCEAILDKALANLRVALEESEGAVTHGALPTVTGDSSQLAQLFQNLIGNALKFRGDSPPRIHVSSRRHGKEWIFTVQDNGIGIDSEFAERIFVIFQRLHSREEYPGTGIGLAICRKIVERHGGRIWVESQSDRGSTFYFSIAPPAREPESEMHGTQPRDTAN